jgi:hypothetical protein
MKKKLHAAAADIGANRKALQKARQDLVARARAQLDTVHGPIEAGAKALDKGKGGVLHHRYVRTRSNERDRLRAVVAEYPSPAKGE